MIAALPLEPLRMREINYDLTEQSVQTEVYTDYLVLNGKEMDKHYLTVATK